MRFRAERSASSQVSLSLAENRTVGTSSSAGSRLRMMTSTRVETHAAIGIARITAKPPKRMPTEVTETRTTSGVRPTASPRTRGNDKIVLEQPHAEHDGGGEDGDGRRDGEPYSDGEPSCCERADDRDDLDDAGECAEKNPVGLSDRPECKREHDSDDGNEEQLPSDECAELEIDENPGVADELPFRPWDE